MPGFDGTYPEFEHVLEYETVWNVWVLESVAPHRGVVVLNTKITSLLCIHQVAQSIGILTNIAAQILGTVQEHIQALIPVLHLDNGVCMVGISILL